MFFLCLGESNRGERIVRLRVRVEDNLKGGERYRG